MAIKREIEKKNCQKGDIFVTCNFLFKKKVLIAFLEVDGLFETF